MLLPYASYLRVYEPAEQLTTTLHATQTPETPDAVTSMTLEREQLSVLTRLVSSPTGTRVSDDLAGCYVMERSGALFVCPLDLALRSWLALASFADETDQRTRGLFFVSNRAEAAEEQFAHWRQANPVAAAHIRSSTWGVPRTWFLLVEESERERYDAGGSPSVRFRTPIATARERLASASAELTAMIDDEELLSELDDLGEWLGLFPAGSWVEVDYAGIAGLLGVDLAGDRSAAEIGGALAAMQRQDFAAAGESYRHFVERWRAVNALERAN